MKVHEVHGVKEVKEVKGVKGWRLRFLFPHHLHVQYYSLHTFYFLMIFLVISPFSVFIFKKYVPQPHEDAGIITSPAVPAYS